MEGLSSRPESEINSIQFDIFDSEEVLRYSVAEINKTDLGLKNTDGTVYDKRMGVITKGEECPTCSETTELCTGHFGHIALVEPLLHPLFIKEILNILRCICYGCRKVIVSNEMFKLNGLGQYRKTSRINKIQKDYQNCCYCLKKIDDYKTDKESKKIKSNYDGKDVIVTPLEIENIFGNLSDEDKLKLDTVPLKFIIRNLPVLPTCCRPTVITAEGVGHDDLTHKYMEIIKYNNFLSELMKGEPPVKKKGRKSKIQPNQQDYYKSLVFHVKTLFDNTKGDSKQIQGRPLKSFKELMSGKKGRIRGNLMGKRCDYTARTVIGPGMSLYVDEVGIPTKIADTLSVPIRVAAFNKPQLIDKIRNGKIDVVNVSKKGENDSEKIFVPKNFYGYQKYKLIEGDKIIPASDKTKLIDYSRYRFYKGKDYKLKNGDTIVRKSPFTGKENEEERIIYDDEKDKLNIKLEEGDIVNRKLMDNDWILINRQPTLHKASMMAHKVKVMPGNTIKMNVAVCGPYNADFDGDEMNLHVPQSETAACEIQNLSAVGENINNEQASRPTIKICQDAVTAGILLTREYIQIEKSLFFDCCLEIDDSEQVFNKFDIITRTFYEYWKKNPKVYSTLLKKYPKFDSQLTGHSLFSLLLPNDLEYEVKENNLVITKGVMVSGYLDSTILGNGRKSLVKILDKYYTVKQNVDFISRYQFVINRWLAARGFSVGISDCLIPENIKKAVGEKIQKTLDDIKNEDDDNKALEQLNNLRNVASKITKEMLPNTNALKVMIASGAKGTFNNITQIMYFMGQQNVEDGRVLELFGKGENKRTLPHYPILSKNGSKPKEKEDFNIVFDDKTSDKIKDKYRIQKINSRGFVFNNLMNGLSPQEFFFHAMGGRIGVIDTSIKTAVCGYTTRKLVKFLEDMVVTYNGTITNSKNRIISFGYGDDGMNAGKLVQVDGATTEQFVNVQFLADKINSSFTTK